MDESTGVSHVGEHRSAGTVSIPLTLAAGLLIGVGLIGIAYWLLSFSWTLMLSFLPFTLGAVLLFTRATGPDHA